MVTVDNGQLVYRPGNNIQITQQKEYFDSILVDGKEVLTPGEGTLRVDTLVNPVVKVRFKKGITYINYCFRNCNLLSISGDLFRDYPEINSFRYCFQNCIGLTSIPKDLFKYNLEATDFGSCFYQCYNLTSIPEDLFMYNPKVTNFTYCFYRCGKLKTMPIDSDGTPIYNRSSPGKPEYSIVTDFGDCFYNCRSIEGYDSIPERWK